MLARYLIQSQWRGRGDFVESFKWGQKTGNVGSNEDWWVWTSHFVLPWQASGLRNQWLIDTCLQRARVGVDRVEGGHRKVVYFWKFECIITTEPLYYCMIVKHGPYEVKTSVVRLCLRPTAYVVWRVQQVNSAEVRGWTLIGKNHIAKLTPIVWLCWEFLLSTCDFARCLRSLNPAGLKGVVVK